LSCGLPAALRGSSAPPPTFLTEAERRLLDLLSDRIVPTDDSSPGARAARVAERIDVVLAGRPEAERLLWREGLRGLEQACRERFAKELADASPEEHDALLADLAGRETSPETAPERFFVALKAQTVDAYYTSEIGLRQELRYAGNTYLADFAGCTHSEHQTAGSDPLSDQAPTRGQKV
jgi:hypothetical protein